MIDVRGHRGSVPLAIVVAASVAGSLGLALAARSGPASGDVAAAVARCPAARELASDARVAVVDSGIERSALPASTVVGKRVDLTDDPGQPLAAHGTEMASIVVARAPSARLIDIRVLDAAGSGSASAVASGIEAARRAGADVVNLSAAVPASDPEIRAAIERATDDGIVVVVAAGNDARDLSRDPAWRRLAADPCTVVVGATDAGGAHLRSSNHGDGVVEAWAVGEGVRAIGVDGRPTTSTGTSPAAATVTATLLA
ncbi:MAG: S8 family serine peptidase [Aquihabitans sp.]